MGRDCINVDSIHFLRSHLGSQDGQHGRAAAHIHHHLAPYIVPMLQHRGEHHTGGVVMTGTERHLRTELDIVPCPGTIHVVSLSDRHRAVHHYGLESFLPIRIPVAERDRNSQNGGSEGKVREHKPERPPVIKLLLDIAFQILVPDDEGIVWELGYHCLNYFGILL